jgi:hypothetical protein
MEIAVVVLEAVRAVVLVRRRFDVAAPPVAPL